LMSLAMIDDGTNPAMMKMVGQDERDVERVLISAFRPSAMTKRLQSLQIW
jgi:hypothetical protein